MSIQQTEFVLRNDGFWWAPPIDPGDDCDYLVRFANMLGADDTIDSIISVNVAYATLGGSEITESGKSVAVWLSSAVNKKTVLVAIKILTTGGRKFERSFKIECSNL